MTRRRATRRAKPKAVGPTLWSRTRRAGAAVVLVAAVGAAGYLGWQHRDLLPSLPEEGVAPVKRVLVEGPFEQVTTDDVENAVLPHLTGGFFTVDLDAIRDAAERLPWVATAQVMREWPDAIHIVVTEEVPAWRWGEDGLLNARAELFVTGVAQRPESLPRLDGPSGAERQTAELYLELDGALAACSQRVARLELDGRRAVRATLAAGPVVELGREGVVRRIERFCGVVVDTLRPRFDAIATVDMRYTNGFAVGWRSPAADAGRGG